MGLFFLLPLQMKPYCQKIKPQDILEDIPDDIIDIDISGLKGILTLEAWRKLKDTGKNLV